MTLWNRKYCRPYCNKWQLLLDKLLLFLMTSSRLWRAVSVFIYTLFYLMNQILGAWNITQIKDVGSSLVHKSKWWEESKHQSEKHPVMDNVVVFRWIRWFVCSFSVEFRWGVGTEYDYVWLWEDRFHGAAPVQYMTHEVSKRSSAPARPLFWIQ